MPTIGSAGEQDKELVRHAMRGELPTIETDDGWEFEAASREDCERFVLEVVDKWVCQCKELADSGRAVERVMSRHGFKLPWKEYMDEMAAASREYNDFLTEGELDEFADEIDEIERGRR